MIESLITHDILKNQYHQQSELNLVNCIFLQFLFFNATKQSFSRSNFIFVIL